jgi:hypothetical protein
MRPQYSLQANTEETFSGKDRHKPFASAFCQPKGHWVTKTRKND